MLVSVDPDSNLNMGEINKVDKWNTLTIPFCEHGINIKQVGYIFGKLCSVSNDGLYFFVPTREKSFYGVICNFSRNISFVQFKKYFPKNDGDIMRVIGFDNDYALFLFENETYLVDKEFKVRTIKVDKEVFLVANIIKMDVSNHLYLVYYDNYIYNCHLYFNEVPLYQDMKTDKKIECITKCGQWTGNDSLYVVQYEDRTIELLEIYRDRCAYKKRLHCTFSLFPKIKLTPKYIYPIITNDTVLIVDEDDNLCELHFYCVLFSYHASKKIIINLGNNYKIKYDDMKIYVKNNDCSFLIDFGSGSMHKKVQQIEEVPDQLITDIKRIDIKSAKNI